MSLSSVLAALKFYDGTNFNDLTDPETTAAQFSENDKTLIISALSLLYNSSTICQGMLDGLSQNGSINFGFRSGLGGVYVPPGFTIADGFTDPYIMIDPHVQLKGINVKGELFDFDWHVALAH